MHRFTQAFKSFFDSGTLFRLSVFADLVQ